MRAPFGWTFDATHAEDPWRARILTNRHVQEATGEATPQNNKMSIPTALPAQSVNVLACRMSGPPIRRCKELQEKGRGPESTPLLSVFNAV